MSNNFNDVLTKYKTQALIFNKTWHEVHFSIMDFFNKSQHQLANHSDFINKLKTQSNLINEQYIKVLNLIDKPEIRLAITGTTSSGKSSLVNFLCGREVMPRDAGEMSAGMVSIIHSPTVKLVIRNTKNAKWACGNFLNISDEDIQDRLKKLMLEYHRVKNQKDIEYPQIELHCPIRLGSQYNILGLPQNFGLTIIDLPGLNSNSEVDKVNLQVITDGAKNALSIVVFNSEFATKDSERDLLNSIISLIKQMKASPKNILFLQNRADALLKDSTSIEDYKIKLEYKVKECLDVIKSKISQEFSEYPKHEVNSIQLAKLSPTPALFSNLMLGANDKDLWKKYAQALKPYMNLVPNEIADDLPGINRWEHDDKNIVAKHLLNNSFANNFESYLGSHIKNNLKELVYHHQFNLLKQYVNEAKQLIDSQLASLKSTVDADAQKKQQNEINNLKRELERSISNLESDYIDVENSTQDYYSERANQLMNASSKEANDVATSLKNAIVNLKNSNDYSSMTKGIRNLESVFRVPERSLEFLGALSDNFLALISRFARTCEDLFNSPSNLVQTRSDHIRSIFREQQLSGAEYIINQILALKNDRFFQQLQTETAWERSSDKGKACQQVINNFSREFENIVALFYKNYMSREKYRVDLAFSTLKKAYIHILYEKLKDYAGDSAEYLLQRHSEKEFEWNAPNWETFFAKVNTAQLRNSGGWVWDTWEILKFNGVLNNYASTLKSNAKPKFATALQNNLTRLMQHIEQDTLTYLKDYQDELIKSIRQRQEQDISQISKDRQNEINALNTSTLNKQRAIEQAIFQARAETIAEINATHHRLVPAFNLLEQSIKLCLGA